MPIYIEELTAEVHVSDAADDGQGSQVAHVARQVEHQLAAREREAALRRGATSFWDSCRRPTNGAQPCP